MNANRICEVCNKKPPRYRCPKCLIRYCSLDCFKSHQASLCRGMQSSEIKLSANTSNKLITKSKVTDNEESLEDDKVPEDMLHKLDDSAAVREMLSNRHLVDILRHLDSTEDANSAICSAMREPIFIEFADECLRIVEPNNNENDASMREFN